MLKCLEQAGQDRKMIQHKAPQNAGRKAETKGPPFTFCFFIQCDQGSGTGPVHQGEKQDADSCFPGPAM